MDFYSRMVALFKVVLPLAALAILATLFLISRGINFEAEIPFSEQEIAERLRDQQITGPFFSGTTANGDEIIVSARRARPGGAGAMPEATDVSARLTTAKGGRITLRSDRVSVDGSESLAVFAGAVRIGTNTGLVVTTEELHTALEGVQGRTPGEIEGTGPFGDFTAGQMEFGEKNPGGPLRVLFKSGVKLIYDPKKTE